MSLAVITLEFDPVLRLTNGVLVRWQTVALVALVLAGLLLTGLIARREGLRPDDLLFIAVAVVPGAVIGGRLGYVLLHLDYYGANKAAILDPGQGSLELGLAIVGGVLSGSYVAALLGAPIGAWLRAAALPLLFMVGAGKLAMVLGGSGQGEPANDPWALAFQGPGPWGSLAADVPSHPSQVYEGVASLAILAILTLVVASGQFRRPDGRLFFVALALWAFVRVVVSSTWRDTPAVGPLAVGGVIALLLAIAAAGALAVSDRRRIARIQTEGQDVDWADPATRPRF